MTSKKTTEKTDSFLSKREVLLTEKCYGKKYSVLYPNDQVWAVNREFAEVQGLKIPYIHFQEDTVRCALAKCGSKTRNRQTGA